MWREENVLIKSDFLKPFLRSGLKVLCVVAVVCAAVLSSAQSTITVKTYSSAGAGRITVGPNPALWFTETATGKIGRITTSGVITEYAIPTANSYRYGITTGPDGALSFTEIQSQKIGRITTDASVTEYPAGGSPSSSSLLNITAGPDGALWFNKHCFGISRITTAGVVTDYPTVSCPFGITLAQMVPCGSLISIKSGVSPGTE
jgi:streptogramin lyase